MNTHRIIIKNLTKIYKEQVILENISLVLDVNNIYFMTKENGGGKTTFFRCLLRECGFSGTIEDRKLAYTYLPEKPYLPSYVTVKTFLVMFLDDMDKYQLIEKYLYEFNILKYKDYYLNRLSKGTKQKVAIIKTILSNADVFLFDEPLSGLDKESRKTFFKMISKIKDKIIVIATHYYKEYNVKNKKVILE